MTFCPYCMSKLVAEEIESPVSPAKKPPLGRWILVAVILCVLVIAAFAILPHYFSPSQGISDQSGTKESLSSLPSSSEDSSLANQTPSSTFDLADALLCYFTDVSAFQEIGIPWESSYSDEFQNITYDFENGISIATDYKNFISGIVWDLSKASKDDKSYCLYGVFPSDTAATILERLGTPFAGSVETCMLTYRIEPMIFAQYMLDANGQVIYAKLAIDYADGISLEDINE